MDEGRRERSALAIELRHALERDEFELYYQPQHDVMSGEISAYEALLRWHHRERGIVEPEVFIPIAEENGLIIPIGEWVLKTACAEVSRWRKPYKICVNIASAQLTQSDLPRLVHETLLSTGLAPSRLELEITEASIIDDRDRALHVVRQLKSLGVSIAMDDYGVGYSSLSTLQIFPFDRVKIDRSFVEDVANDTASAAIVRATILLANDLNIPVLAEGVEKQENFVCENIFQFTVTFQIEVTQGSGSSAKLVSVPVTVGRSSSGSVTDSFKIKGTGIETEASGSGVTADELKSGRVKSVEISLTVLTDAGIDQVRRGGMSDAKKAEFMAKHSYQYTKLIQLPSM